MTATPATTCERDDQFVGLALYFKVGACLGEPGAFGSVYEITDRRTKDRYAVKVLKIPKPDSSKYQIMMGMYRQEIDILGSLSHPGIVRLERVMRCRSYVYLIMEQCHGGDLFDYICDRGGRLSEKEAALIFYQILQPVVYLHEVAGVAHCDIKLANIMFSDSEAAHGIKLIDFGVSSRCQAGAVLTGRSGTTAFMAPEQIKQRYGTQVDLWSLGVVLYIMLFGFSPWDPYCTSDNKTIESVILKGFSSVVLPGYGPWFPQSIPSSDLAQDLISKLLTYNPDQRLTAAEAIEHPWLVQGLAD